MSLTRINNQALPTLDSDKLPTGTVIKSDVLVGQTAGSQTNHNSSTYNTAFTVTYTPQAWGSKVLILTNLGLWADVDNDSHTPVQGQIRMLTSFDGGTTYTERWESGQNIIARGGHSRYAVSPIAYEMDLPASGTSLMIRWQGRRTASDRSFIIGGYLGSQITVTEIAG